MRLHRLYNIHMEAVHTVAIDTWLEITVQLAGSLQSR